LFSIAQGFSYSEKEQKYKILGKKGADVNIWAQMHQGCGKQHNDFSLFINFIPDLGREHTV
jgi:hypothetical protein